jgi:hypothetical protein
MYEVARRQYEESFADPDDPDHVSSPVYSYGPHGSVMGNDGFTLAGHFVGIEQLSLNDTFVLTSPGKASGGKLSNIKAFQVNGDSNGNESQGARAKAEVTEDDVREALEQTMRQRVPA